MGEGLQVTFADERRVLAPHDVLVVGRGREADLVVDDPLVSRRHCRISSHNGSWLIEDLDSNNGTYVDGCRITSTKVDGPMIVALGASGSPAALRLDPMEMLTVSPQQRAGGQPAPGATDQLVGEVSVMARVHAAATTSFTIGRADDCDIVVDDLAASRRHASVRRLDHGAEIVDLGSHNGTFVNGRPVTRAVLTEHDLVGIGHHLFRLVGGTLEEYVDTGAIRLEAQGLTVEVAHGKVILDDIRFSLDERSLMAVVGPSGSGKSTLMKALTGFRPATSGTVWYTGRDLYAAYADLRHRIGYVPQDDVLHLSLPVREALLYAARLRFPPDVARSELETRVDEVIAELGLAGRADVPISRLSGGQRKRASVGFELLTKPSLLFLDEPTSGLDPGYERTLTRTLRRLADGDRTVVVVTHSVQSLDLCDRVLVLAEGGRLAYFGSPEEALTYFRASGYAELFERLETEDEPDWPGRFLASPQFERYVEGPQMARELARTEGVRVPPLPVRQQGWWRQLATLSRRYAAVIGKDRRFLAMLILQAPLLGLLLLMALPSNELAPRSNPVVFSSAAIVLAVTLTGVTWLGLSNSIREIVKEEHIYRRERAIGLSVSAYVLSKTLVLGVITSVQAIVVVVIALGDQGSGWGPALIEPPMLEIAVTAVLGGFAAMTLGLLVSAAVRSADRATAILPLLLLVQLLLSGAFQDITERPVLREASYVTSTHWAFSGGAATVDLARLQVFNDCLFAAAPSGDISSRDVELIFVCVRLGLAGSDLAELESLRSYLAAATEMELGEIDDPLAGLDIPEATGPERTELKAAITSAVPNAHEREVDRVLDVLDPQRPLRYWDQDPAHWMINIGVLAAMSLAALLGAWAILVRRDRVTPT